MKIFFSISVCILFLFLVHSARSQQPGFNRVSAKPTNSVEVFTGITEDQQGYIWLTSFVGGLHRYNGTKFITYTHDPRNPRSIASDWTECLSRDSSNFIWVGTWGSGLDRLDPVTNIFTHFRHNPKDKQSLINDTVSAIITDHSGNIWVGTYGGLELFDRKTSGFIHFPFTPENTSGLSDNEIRVLYEDQSGTIWLGCGSPFSDDPKTGGLNRFDKATGKFTRYMHDDNNPNSLTTNKVRAILEDSKGNFWVGTTGDGLHTMDRSKGIFTHHYYDAAHPENLSRPPLNKEWTEDHITFIKEDRTGSIWIGSFYGGINRYDPETKKVTHYGNVLNGAKVVAKDTISGFAEFGTWHALVSSDGLLWFSVNQEAQKHNQASLYTINPVKTIIPYHKINLLANSFYLEPDSNILWTGTSKGLIRKELNSKNEKIFLHDSAKANSLIYNNINSIKADGEGNLWIGTMNGLSQFNTRNNTFTSYKHDEKVQNSLSSNNINFLFVDHNKNLWISTQNSGIDKMDRNRRTFINYNHYDNDSNSLSSASANCIAEDQNHLLWVGTSYGLDRLDKDNKIFRHYLPALIINSVFADASGIVWAGTADSLYRFDSITNQFLSFSSPNLFEPIKGVLAILEDDRKNLWISTTNAIIKINEKRDEVKTYGENYGVHQNSFSFSDNFKSSNGEIFIGDQDGYYSFFPDQLNKGSSPPRLNLTGFKIRDKEIASLANDTLVIPVWQAKEIKLKYNENIFSFDFIALHYDSPGEVKYIFMLQNYDNVWQDIGTEHKAYFSNVPPGSYIFRIKAFNGDGAWSEKNIAVIISPPWYRTWWAYASYILVFLIALWSFIKWRESALKKEKKLLEEKVVKRTHELQEEKEKVESTLTELKSTQAQLIQSEKMASLGELTAGIAHEIQNPLNFVNNFSEVNKEMLEELKAERLKPKAERDEQTEEEILNDVLANEEKINHHGKRADAIVKGMLQHSQTSAGQRELTDINKLADEYLRLSYQGFRAKDKLFNATLLTDFDDIIGKINIIPQDIGRVLLNLYNNAFYAVSQKHTSTGSALTESKEYEPIVSVSTKKIGDKVEIKVKDNGSGIPQKILDKIFQPFFTTKPTGQGTGLGLSLAYDIVKAHGGEIKVYNKEIEGAEFIVDLLITK